VAITLVQSGGWIVTDTLLLLAPVILLVIVVLFGFTGCGQLLSDSEPSTPVVPAGPPPDPYGPIVQTTAGILVRWGLNEPETPPPVQAVGSGLINVNGAYHGGAKVGVPGAFHHKSSLNLAVDFNGASAYIEMPFQQSLNPIPPNIWFSVEVWIKPRTGNVVAPQVVVSSQHTAAGGGQRGYEIALVPNGAGTHDVRAAVYAPNAVPPDAVVATPVGGNPQAWRHIVLTYNGMMGAQRTLALYVNVAGTGPTPVVSMTGARYQEVPSATTLRFGAGHAPGGGANQFFDGVIDEVAFYQLALPAPAIYTHFQAY
jgi:hypothetical protein